MLFLSLHEKKAAASSEFTSLEGSGLEYPKYLWD
jgi:hypothetical protein